VSAYSMKSHRKNARLLLILGLLVWLTGIIITPILAAGDLPLGKKLASFMYFFYKPVCHQISDRSFMLDGFTLAVCNRCFAFYLGGLFICIIYFFRDKIYMLTRISYILLVLPALLDFILEKVDLYTNVSGLRLFTGLLLGIAVFQLLFVSLFMESQRKKLIPSIHPTQKG